MPEHSNIGYNNKFQNNIIENTSIYVLVNQILMR